MKHLKIKVCGMREPGNLEQLCELVPDFVGFIFYPHSKRYVGRIPDPALFRIPGPAIKKAGVFVNQELSHVTGAVEDYSLDMVQLHGGEPVDYCRRVAEAGVKVIKVLDPRGLPADLERYSQVVHFFLFDSAGEGKGGSGLKFDWNLLQHLDLPVPFLLSGGIGPGDTEALRNIHLQGMAGVDINSRFELLPGIKDIQKLKKFIYEIRK